jgi:hypothetical protein
MSATNATRVHPSVYSVPASVPASDAPASDAPASESGALAEAARLFARAVREELDAAAPSAALLPVVFSRVLDQSWSKVPLDSDQVCTSGLNTIRNREAPFFQVCTSGFTEERVCGYFVY